jgi:hypothetical protein
VAAVEQVTKLDRAKVRARFDERFAIERVAKDYLNVYRALPGVRRATRLIPALQQAEIARLDVPLSSKPSLFPGLQLLGRPQTLPTD